MRSHASARTSSQYGFPSRCVFAAADSTCTCTRAGTALPLVRDAARRISVKVSKSISINLTQVANACSVRCPQRTLCRVCNACPDNSPLRHMYAPFAQCFLKHLECSACGLHHEWSRLQNVCLSCQKPLFAIVDLAAASRTLTREALATREKSLWRYRALLPLPDNVEPISPGEGGTPLLRASGSCRTK